MVDNSLISSQHNNSIAPLADQNQLGKVHKEEMFIFVKLKAAVKKCLPGSSSTISSSSSSKSTFCKEKQEVIVVRHISSIMQHIIKHKIDYPWELRW